MTSPGQGFVFDLLFAWIVPALFVISEGIKSSSGFGRVWSITQISFFILQAAIKKSLLRSIKGALSLLTNKTVAYQFQDRMEDLPTP